jgi:hypothetical protein
MSHGALKPRGFFIELPDYLLEQNSFEIVIYNPIL